MQSKDRRDNVQPRQEQQWTWSYQRHIERHFPVLYNQLYSLRARRCCSALLTVPVRGAQQVFQVCGWVGVDSPLSVKSDLEGNRVSVCHRHRWRLEWWKAGITFHITKNRAVWRCRTLSQSVATTVCSLKASAIQHQGMYFLLPSLPPRGKGLPRTILLPSPSPGQACCGLSLQGDGKDHENWVETNSFIRK